MARSIPISKTKIVVPHRRPELLSRPRLLESLRASLDRKLILLSAPAGYGKTSLLVDFAHTTDLPVCWLSLDPLDRDPQRFIAYAVAALAERFPGLAAPLEPLLNELKSIERDAEPLLVALTNELYEQVEDNFLFVIDDYHLLDDVPVISSLLNRFVQLVDENCHVILSSRVPPALPDLALMLAREQVDGFSQMELAFLPREIQAFFSQNHHQHLTDQAAQELIKQTGGWITGIILTNQTGASGMADVDTFAYLSRQVLDQQPESLRGFLLRTSLPDEFNAELCEVILAPFHTGQQNWPDLMSQVLKKNLFVLPLGGVRERWLRYHPLFREFLQGRLREERPQEVKPILERLTHAYQQRGDWEKAYYTCQQLGDPEALAATVEAGGTPMLQRAFTTLDGWLNSLPPSLVRKRPGLTSLRGAMATMKSNPPEAIELLSGVEAIYRKRKDIRGLSVALVRRAFAYRMLGRYTESLRDAEEVLQLTETHNDMQPIYAEALRVKGQDLYRLGQARQAVEYFERSLVLCTTLKETANIPRLLRATGMAYSVTGDVETAKSYYQQALKIWEAEKNFYEQVDLMNNLAVLYHQNGEYELAVETFEDGLMFARKSHNQHGEAIILLGLGDLYAEVEEYESASLAYQKAEPIVRQFQGSFIHIYLALARANLAILQGDAVEARRVLKSGARVLRASQSLYERGMCALLKGRIHLLEEHAQKAVTVLKESKAYFMEDGRQLESLWACIWLAAALDCNGQTDMSREEVREILSIPRGPNHAALVMLRQAGPWFRGLQRDAQIGRNLRGALEKAQRLEEKLPAIRRALRRQAQSIQMSAASLVVRAFGRAEVRIDGRTVSMSEWSVQSVRDLLFYFLYKGEAVTKEQIAAALWPEIDDPQVLKQRFKAYIFRLRRATRRDVIIFDEEYYRFNHSLDYEYDVEAFQTYVARARSSRKIEERIQNYQKAADLIKGPYLEDVDAPWALGERERLELAHLAALEELAKLYLDTNRLEEAIAACQRALAIDTYRETAHQIAIRAHAARGERKAVIHQYQVCKAALEELDLSPSEETEALYRELTA